MLPNATYATPYNAGYATPGVVGAGVYPNGSVIPTNNAGLITTPSPAQPLALLLLIFLVLTGVAVYIFQTYILPPACEDLLSTKVITVKNSPLGAVVPQTSTVGYVPQLR